MVGKNVARSNRQTEINGEAPLLFFLSCKMKRSVTFEGHPAEKNCWFVFSQSALAAATNPLLRIVFDRSERKSGERETLWPRVCACVYVCGSCASYFTALCANCPRIRIASIGCVRAACCEPSGHELLLSRASRSHTSRFMQPYTIYICMYICIRRYFRNSEKIMRQEKESEGERESN